VHLAVLKVHKQISEANFSLHASNTVAASESIGEGAAKDRAKKGERKTMMKNSQLFFLPEAVYDMRAYHAVSRAEGSRDDPRTTEERGWIADSS